MGNREHFEEVWRFDTARFSVVYEVGEECDLDLSWDDDGSTREGLENGSLVAFVARVRVLLDGREVSEDCLGGCIYRSALEFIDHRGSKGKWGSYFRDMVANTTSDARKYLAGLPRLREGLSHG